MLTRSSGRACWQRGAAAAAVLVILTAAGCGGSSPPRSSGQPQSGSPAPTGTGRATPRSPSTGGNGAQPAAEPAGTGARSGVSGGTLFGGSVPLVQETGKLGRNLAIVRMYFRIGEPFPPASAKAVMRKGGTLLASLDSVPGRHEGTYASIIAGQDDAAIKRFLQRLEQSAVTYHLGAIYFSFEHEANTPPHRTLGTPAQFIEAWDHVHALAASAHLLWNDGGRVHFVLILTNKAYRPLQGRPAWAAKEGQASTYFPGTNEVDIVAADGYNTGGCRHASQRNSNSATTGWSSSSSTLTPEDIFGPLVSFARSHGGLPVFIAEWASAVYASNEQANYITQMRAFVAVNHEIAAVMYWNGHSPQHPACIMSIDNQSVSVATLAAMGHAAALQGHLVDPRS